jgi:APA family basic amino acid/polyamine antiporter
VGNDTIAQIVSFGALAGLTTVMLILMLGQSRVFFAMSRDRLLPPFFSHVSRRFRTPYRSTILTGVAVAALAGLIPLDTLAELVNIGTLFAFIVVAGSILVLRRTHPDLERAFTTPWVPVLPIVSMLASLYVALNLPAQTWERFLIWMALGFIVYFFYARSHSRLAEGADTSSGAS